MWNCDWLQVGWVFTLTALPCCTLITWNDATGPRVLVRLNAGHVCCFIFAISENMPKSAGFSYAYCWTFITLDLSLDILSCQSLCKVTMDIFSIFVIVLYYTGILIISYSDNLKQVIRYLNTCLQKQFHRLWHIVSECAMDEGSCWCLWQLTQYGWCDTCPFCKSLTEFSLSVAPHVSSNIVLTDDHMSCPYCT